MRKEWRVPLALVTADVVLLSLSFLVLIVLYASTLAQPVPWQDVFFYGAFILSAAHLIGWLVVSWKRIREPGDREMLIKKPKELALASIGILFCGSWLAMAGAMQPTMSGLMIPYVFTGLVVAPWAMVACIVWFWYSV